MSDFIEISADAVIKQSRTKTEKDYIVYYYNNEIRVNTNYFIEGNKVRLCRDSYDRVLCNTLEEYNDLSIEYIESQAYGSWMDGAR